MSGMPTSDEGLIYRETPEHPPAFFPDPDTGRLLAVINALTAELVVLRSRLDTHERLAAAGGFDRERVDAFEPDAGAAAERHADTQAIVSRVFQVYADEAERLARGGLRPTP